jgi:hypothetical protein
MTDDMDCNASSEDVHKNKRKRIIEHPIQSINPIHVLPLELWYEILPYLDEKSLATLSLCDRICLCLVKSHRLQNIFKPIKIILSDVDDILRANREFGLPLNLHYALKKYMTSNIITKENLCRYYLINSVKIDCMIELKNWMNKEYMMAYLNRKGAKRNMVYYLYHKLQSENSLTFFIILLKILVRPTLLYEADGRVKEYFPFFLLKQLIKITNNMELIKMFVILLLVDKNQKPDEFSRFIYKPLMNKIMNLSKEEIKRYKTLIPQLDPRIHMWNIMMTEDQNELKKTKKDSGFKQVLKALYDKHNST